MTEQDVGKPKAQVVCEMMMEMNPDVKGDFLNISVEDFIQNKLSDITGCQLVIACDLTVK